jgi:CII-binding regulator of phage lambda lysogenization HflD
MSMIAFRIDDDISDKIEQLRGDKSASIYCKNVIFEHVNNVNNSVSSVNNTDYIKQLDALQNALTNKEEISKLLEDRIKDLHNQIRSLDNQNGFLISEFQRINKINEQLLLSPAPEEKIERKWWEFWKK